MATSILSLFFCLIFSVPGLSWSKEAVVSGLTPSEWPQTVPVLAPQKQKIISDFKRLFKILERGGPIDSVLDRRQWPDNDLLASYLELELLFHPRYRKTIERLQQFLRRWPHHSHADWVGQQLEYLLAHKGKDGQAIAWYDRYNPTSERAKIRYLDLLFAKKRTKDAHKLWQSLYQEGVLFPKEIQAQSQNFEKQLSTAKRERRARSLLQKRLYPEFQHLLRQLPVKRQAYFQTLEAGYRGYDTFDVLLKTLPPDVSSHSELWDARAKGLRQSSDLEEVKKFLLSKSAAQMSAKNRHLLRFRLGRTYYVKHNYSAAMELLGANVTEAGGELSDSLWLAGWSAYLNKDFKKARDWFILLAKEGVSGHHRSQGGFWAYRLSRSEEEKAHWLGVASRYPGNFYGLLAKELTDGPLKPLPDTTITCSSDLEKVANRKQDLKLLKSVGRSYYNGVEIPQLADRYQLSLSDQLCLAQELGAPDLVIQLANQLSAKGQPVWNGLYPIPIWAPSRGWELDPALVWSASRQESLFFHRAESSTKAMGLMQLMPATARMEAKRLGMLPSNPFRLQLPAYNLTLGQSYLSRMLEQFKGDLVLAAASYNAGPGRGNRWKKRRDKEDPFTFIENIPFTETRNYVKRVIHGLAMYRLQLYGSASILSLIKPEKQDFSPIR